VLSTPSGPGSGPGQPDPGPGEPGEPGEPGPGEPAPEELDPAIQALVDIAAESSLDDSPVDPEPEADELVEIRIPASPSQIPAVRTLASDLATRLDFDLDAVSDLRMAVDEASATLISRSAPRAQLACVFRVHRDSLEVVATVPTEDGKLPRQDTFGWAVLTTLVDVADASVDAARAVTIKLVKRRALATGS
jgi:serine/threonine-protein kinase RsbW